MISENEKKEQIELYLQGKGMKREIWKTLDKKEQKELRKSIKKSNSEKALKEMDKIFEEKNIDKESYRETYGITLKNFMRALIKNRLNELYFLTKKERYKIIEGFYKQKGLKDKWDYQIKYRRTEKSLDKWLWMKGSKDINDFDYQFTVDEKNDIPSPEEIFSIAKEKVPEGRTAGVSFLEIGNIASVAKYYYRGGLNQLNKDLGLEPIVILDDYETTKQSAPTKQEIKIEQITKKIDNLVEKIKPEKFEKLKDELLAVKDLEEEELENIDTELFNKLETSIEESLNINAGYLYFKKWDLPETTWFKIGKTNNPDRRDLEQNVLPVPAQTLYLLKLDSMEQASSVERAILKTLGDRRIIGAKNKELFKLGGSDYKAVIKALKNLSNKLNKQEKES